MVTQAANEARDKEHITMCKLFPPISLPAYAFNALPKEKQDEFEADAILYHRECVIGVR